MDSREEMRWSDTETNYMCQRPYKLTNTLRKLCIMEKLSILSLVDNWIEIVTFQHALVPWHLRSHHIDLIPFPDVHEMAFRIIYFELCTAPLYFPSTSSSKWNSSHFSESRWVSNHTWKMPDSDAPNSPPIQSLGLVECGCDGEVSWRALLKFASLHLEATNWVQCHQWMKYVAKITNTDTNDALACLAHYCSGIALCLVHAIIKHLLADGWKKWQLFLAWNKILH